MVEHTSATTIGGFCSQPERCNNAPFREEFRVPEGLYYIDGNSLGALPRKTPERIRALIEDEWGHDLIKS